jgi:hypothetical protein
MPISEQANPEVVGVARLYCLTEKDGGYGGPRPELPVVFLDGKPQPMPTYYGGAVRVRVLLRAASNAGDAQSSTPVNNPDGGPLLTVEFSPEPKMGWHKVLNVRLDKVLDEQGNELRAPLPYISELNDYCDVEPCGRLRKTIGYLSPAGPNTASTKIPFRLQVPKEARKLKEVYGFVAAEVLTPMQPLITVENILDAADKTVKGNNGWVKVLEVSRDEKGWVSLKVVVERPSRPEPEAMAVRALLIRGRVPANDHADDLSAVGKILSLVDEKDQAFKLVSAEEKLLDAEIGGTIEYRLTFRPAAGLPKPAKLVYMGQRLTTIDVPFVLKDVPLQ